MQPQQIDRIITVFPCFSSIPRGDWQFANILRVDPWTSHTIQEGHVLQHAVFVLHGCIRIYKISATGREVTLYRVRNGESCVLMTASILGETEYDASASIEAETEVLLLPVNIFKKWMDNDKQLRQFIYTQFVRRVVDVTELLDHIAFKPIHDRLANYLSAKTNGQSGIILITHEQIAIELGTAREVVSRGLKEFERNGILRLSRGKIELINLSSLKNLLRQPPHV